MIQRIKNIKQWLTKKLNKEKSLNISSRKYTTLDLPLEVFIDALVDGNFFQIDNWEDIYLDYCDIVGGQELVQIIEKQVEINNLEKRVITANCLIDLIENSIIEEHNKVFFECLCSLGYESSITEYNKHTFEKYLSQIVPHIKLDAIDAEILRNLIKQPKNENSSKYTRNYFATMLLDIQQELNVKISMTDSTRMYAIAVSKLRKVIEHKNKSL